MSQLGHVALIVVLFVAVMVFAWVGHIASDDMMYIATAREWFQAFPVVPQTHWAERHPLTVPTGLMLVAFGDGEVQSVLATLLYALALALIVYFSTARRFPAAAAFLASLLLILCPLFATQATMVSIDVVEAFFVVVSVLLYWSAIQAGGALPTLFMAGLAAGLAFMCRETSVALVAFYGVLFLARVAMERWRYWLIAAGFVTVLLLEAVYGGIVAGDPLLRLHILQTLTGGGFDPATAEAAGRIAQSGNLITTGPLAPLASLLVNNEFGLLFWLYPIAAWMTCRRNRLTGEQRHWLRLLTLLAVTWIVVVGYLLPLRPLPRYFFVPMVIANITVAVWLWSLVIARRRALAWLTVVVLMASNLALTDLANKDPRWPERFLARSLAASPQLVVHTDPETKLRATFFLQWAGVDPARVIATPPPPGAMFVFVEGNAARGVTGRREAFNRADFQPAAAWPEIVSDRGAPTVLGRALRVAGVDRWLMATPAERLIWSRPPVRVLQRPSAAS